MLITILTDASYCVYTKVAGYGYWIASDRGKKGGGGILKGFFQNPTIPETLAVSCALWHAIKEGLIYKNDTLIIQTDCHATILAYLDKRTNISSKEKKAVSYFWNIIKNNYLNVEFRHVKGHTGEQDNRSRANHHCDQHAKFYMREARKVIQNAQTNVSGRSKHTKNKLSGSGKSKTRRNTRFDKRL